MRRAAIALIVLVATTLATGCAPTSGPVVDGWPIGKVARCEPADRCPELLKAATIGLERRDPGHAAIVRLTLHDEGALIDGRGNQVLHTRSGACCRVARFELADGTVRAIGVGFPGVSKDPVALDYGGR